MFYGAIDLPAIIEDLKKFTLQKIRTKYGSPEALDALRQAQASLYSARATQAIPAEAALREAQATQLIPAQAQAYQAQALYETPARGAYYMSEAMTGIPARALRDYTMGMVGIPAAATAQAARSAKTIKETYVPPDLLGSLADILEEILGGGL